MPRKSVVVLNKSAINVAKIAVISGKLHHSYINANELGCVKITNDEIYANNGYLFAHAPVISAANRPKIKPILIKGIDLLNAHKALGGKDLIMEVGRGGHTFTSTKKPHKIKVEPVKTKISKLADYKRYEPKSDEKAHVALDKNFLRDVLDAMDNSVYKYIKLRIRGPFEAVEFESGDTKGAIMPVYVQE